MPSVRNSGGPGDGREPLGRERRRSDARKKKSKNKALKKTIATRPASFQARSFNEKLSPIVRRPGRKRDRLVAVGPFCSSTYVSIEGTCSDGCPFKGGGCMIPAGFTRFAAARLDAAAVGLSPEEVLYEEQLLVRRAFRGRRIPQKGARGGLDLRLHVGGDIGSLTGAIMVGEIAANWRSRGGGAPWTYTHAWSGVPRVHFGEDVSVLASVELPSMIEDARSLGYAAAITLPELPSAKAFSLPGTSARIVPCPGETRDRTCVECRLCLDDHKLFDMNVAIAFGVHGPQAKLATEAIVRLRRGRDDDSMRTQ
jgi:hypothetical protein